MDTIAFELRREFDKPDEPFAGGTTALRDGTTYDYGEALARGEANFGARVIVTADPELAGLLDGVVALKRTRAPGELADDPEDGVKELDDALEGRKPAELPVVDESVAGLSGAANEGREVDRFGAPLDGEDDRLANPSADTPTTPPAAPELPNLDRMTTAQLEELAGQQDPPVDLDGAANNSERAERIRAALTA